jgi:hypothetical protein
MNVSPEDRILFACARQCFSDQHLQIVKDISAHEVVDWNRVLSTAKLHGVAPLVYLNLRLSAAHTINIPQDILNQFRLCLMHNTIAKQRMQKNLNKALSFFQEKSIKVLLVKGVALDILVYRQPEYTVLSDLDIVISVKRSQVSKQEQQEFVSFFVRTGVEFDYYTHHDVNMNGALPINFEQIWRDAIDIRVGEYPAFVMSPEDMLISLCINSCRKRYFRLKALADIAETVDKLDALNWSKLIEKARAYQCEPIIYTALLVTQRTLGCDLPGYLLESLNINRLRAKIIQSLIQRMSLSAFASLRSDRVFFGRHIDMALLLPYATFRISQIWRRLLFALFYTEDGAPRFKAAYL